MADWHDMEADLLGSWDSMADALLMEAEAGGEAAEARPGEPELPQTLQRAEPTLQKPQVPVAALQAVRSAVVTYTEALLCTVMCRCRAVGTDL